MKITSLHLQNIRSYVDEKISFPEGRVLLSGDIGSGKTTILLAIEFALFGLLRGKTKGNTLLRYGENEGSVTLTITIEHKEITLHRSLKRTKRSIRQDKTWIKQGNDKTECTATELRAKVIDILGYPQSMLSGSKNMIYRYSVYTPQEKMKEILTASKDNRLQKIRRIFRIDKYQRLKDNSDTYRKELRARIRTLKGVDKKITELESKKAKVKEDMEEYEEELSKQQKQIEKLQKNLETIEKRLKDKEQSEKKYQKIREEKRGLEQDIKTKNQRLNKVKKKIERKETILKNTLEKPSKPSKSREEIEETQRKLERINNKNTTNISKAKAKANQYKVQIKKLNEKKQEITSLQNCPTCKQDVGEQHKQKMQEQYKKELKEKTELKEKAAKNVEQYKEKKQKIEAKKQKINKLLKKVQQYEKDLASYKERVKQQKTVEEDLSELKEERGDVKKTIRHNQQKGEELKEKLVRIQPEIKDIKELKTKQKNKREKLRRQEIKHAKKTEKQKNRKEKIQDITQQLQEKQLEKQKKNTYATRKNWLGQQFNNVTSLVEKHVFLSLHRAFNETFRSFFKDLIEDDSIEASIDSDFSPVLTQNGYDTTIENLSGGEKTSVALAYRLALNNTINEKMQDVKTRSILILDEPTDGFSSEQLDRFRDILDSLNTTQTIIVSHEPKMQSVTERILHVQKTNNASQITAT